MYKVAERDVFIISASCAAVTMADGLSEPKDSNTLKVMVPCLILLMVMILFFICICVGGGDK